MSTKGKAARTTTPGTAFKTLSTKSHFTQVHRAWLAIISVANSLAPDAMVFGMGLLYGLMLATVVMVVS
ncbi:hypothetical protein [Rhodoferax antarcticus]|uniref:hypothetical protein n=1 Tax=Rhodoferax antarcticus TaxID=81479 RepID=UPI0022257F22|nr:hypothetical protein [Rhodoferax antarcticus]MCW2310582.1 hypothetical protein [Rhodoferax antarcticus]